MTPEAEKLFHELKDEFIALGKETHHHMVTCQCAKCLRFMTVGDALTQFREVPPAEKAAAAVA